MINPTILTLQLDNKSQQYFNELRRIHFPKEINYIDAHVTLFHQLPSGLTEINDKLRQVSEMKVFSVDVVEVYHTGFGVAFRLESPFLMALRHELQESFAEWLIPQDKQRFRPHITIQNKVTPLISKSLTAELQKTFKPFAATATGLHTWIYRNGPWEALEEFRFLKQ